MPAMGEECKGTAHGVQSPAENESQWQVTVSVPASLPDEVREDLFNTLADVAVAWQPDDREGWDVFISAAAEDHSLQDSHDRLVEDGTALRWLHAEAAYERDQLKAALDVLRDAHHIPYVDEDHQGGNCADIVMSLLSRATRAERDLGRAEASRRDWAAEAVRLDMELERANGLAAGYCRLYQDASDQLHRSIPIAGDPEAPAVSFPASRPVCAVHPTPNDLQVAPSLGVRALEDFTLEELSLSLEERERQAIAADYALCCGKPRPYGDAGDPTEAVVRCDSCGEDMESDMIDRFRSSPLWADYQEGRRGGPGSGMPESPTARVFPVGSPEPIDAGLMSLPLGVPDACRWWEGSPAKQCGHSMQPGSGFCPKHAARMANYMPLATLEIDPTVEAVGGDPLSGTPWAEGGEPA